MNKANKNQIQVSTIVKPRAMYGQLFTANTHTTSKYFKLGS